MTQSTSAPASLSHARMRRIAVRPLAGEQWLDLTEERTGGKTILKTTGDDPQMLLIDAMSRDPLSLKPGAYRVRFAVDTFAGIVEAPKLYLDFGKGFGEGPGWSFPLLDVDAQQWVVEFHLTRTARRVRFDPTITPSGFVVTTLEIETWQALKPWHIEAWVRAFHAAKSRTAAAAGAGAKAGLETARAASAAVLPGSGRYEALYRDKVSVAMGARDAAFAPLRAEPVHVPADAPKLLAMYLPQFHPFKENNAWWGRGFTEWTNVSKAQPQFVGHYQPRLPGELGFYDLRLPEVMARQIELAKHYGVSGFCFHYYWFDGHRLLERPLDQFLAEKGDDFDFPFCLCWANENWTRRWDGAEHDVLMAQNHSPEDHAAVFQDLLRYMKDRRYVLIEGRPLILVYRPQIIPDVAQLARIWRKAAQAAGFPDLFIAATTSFGFSDPASIGFDGIVQFPPHALSVGEITKEVELYNPSFSGKVYSYEKTIEGTIGTLNKTDGARQAFNLFPTVMTAWDNEARKPGKGHIFHGATPALFHRWLSACMDWTARNNPPGRQFAFVNAWNEWGEGTYLEPDRRYGYAFLSAVAAVREASASKAEALGALVAPLEQRQPTCDAVVCVHCFYPDLIGEMADTLRTARAVRPLDAIITIPNTWSIEDAARLIEQCDPVRVLVCANSGRDVLPFIQALRVARDLRYRFGCKVHSKRSLHLAAGDAWRRGLMQSLLGPDALKQVFDLFKRSDELGLLAAKNAFMTNSDPATLRDNRVHLERLAGQFDLDINRLHEFVAGTMFWFRIDALGALARSPIGPADFGPELGEIDGTLAHAFERLFPSLVRGAGYTIQKLELEDGASPYLRA